jgi:hypothetical protein
MHKPMHVHMHSVHAQRKCSMLPVWNYLTRANTTSVLRKDANSQHSSTPPRLPLLCIRLMSKKKYFENNWQLYKDTPADHYQSHTFEEIMSWKVAGWELPSSVYCVIRVTNTDTKKVREHVYQRRDAAQKKVQQLVHQPDIEFVVCDHESIHFLSSEPLNND